MEKKMQKKMFVVVLAAVIAAMFGGCAYGRIAAPTGGALESNCGEFDYGVVGIPPFYTPAGQYATYSSACATRRTVEVIAAQREAVVRGAWAAAAKAPAVDLVARRTADRAERKADSARRIARTTAAVVLSSGEGGAQ